MRSRDWSSDVGSSDRSVLADEPGPVDPAPVVADDHHREVDEAGAADALEQPQHEEHLEGGRQRRQEPEQPEGREAANGSASGRARVCQYLSIAVLSGRTNRTTERSSRKNA